MCKHLYFVISFAKITKGELKSYIRRTTVGYFQSIIVKKIPGNLAEADEYFTKTLIRSGGECWVSS